MSEGDPVTKIKTKPNINHVFAKIKTKLTKDDSVILVAKIEAAFESLKANKMAESKQIKLPTLGA